MMYALESCLAILFGYHRCGADVEQKMVTARQGMEDWFSDQLGATDGRTGVTSNFVNNLVKLVAGDFVDDQGKVGSDLITNLI